MLSPNYSKSIFVRDLLDRGVEVMPIIITF